MEVMYADMQDCANTMALADTNGHLILEDLNLLIITVVALACATATSIGRASVLNAV